MRSTYFKCRARYAKLTQDTENKGINVVMADHAQISYVKRFCAPMR